MYYHIDNLIINLDEVLSVSYNYDNETLTFHRLTKKSIMLSKKFHKDLYDHFVRLAEIYK